MFNKFKICASLQTSKLNDLHVVFTVDS